MVQKFIDVVTTRNNERVEHFCISNCTFQQLTSILTLSEIGDVITITRCAREIKEPGFFNNDNVNES